MEQFRNKLADILEENSISDGQLLQDFDAWDSLTVLTIIATVESDFNINLTAKDLDEHKTVGELLSFIESKK
jgi:acyl carrier protein